MDFSNYIGQEVEFVKNSLEDLKIKYNIAEISDSQKKYDTVLVTQIKTETDGSLILVTDRFLLNI